MNEIKVYIGCCKADFYLLKSCIASIRYWNKVVPVCLLKDISGGDFDTTELEHIFNVSIVPTRYKKLRGYMKLQPYIEHPDERIFLLDSDMVWLGDMMQCLHHLEEDIAVHAYAPPDWEAELKSWYFDAERLKQYYPEYNYPGFLFNGGSVCFNTKIFNNSDFEGIIEWKEGAIPKHDHIFFCEDQGIINYLVAEKYLDKKISLKKIEFQITAVSESAKKYEINKAKNLVPTYKIVHWIGPKNGLNSFYDSAHILRFYEEQYYHQLPKGKIRMYCNRVLRTFLNIDKFIYELLKKIYYYLIPNRRRSAK